MASQRGDDNGTACQDESNAQERGVLGECDPSLGREAQGRPLRENNEVLHGGDEEACEDADHDGEPDQTK